MFTKLHDTSVPSTSMYGPYRGRKFSPLMFIGVYTTALVVAIGIRTVALLPLFQSYAVFCSS